MGKRLVSQARGRGGPRYRSPGHRYKGKPQHHPFDEKEKEGAVYGIVKDIVHCPGHSAPLAAIEYETGERGYIIAPEGLKVNQRIASGVNAPIHPGNTLPLKNIPEGTEVYNIESSPGDNGKFIRTSGGFARIIGKVRDRILLKFPSKKQKEFHPECRATIGIIAGSGRKDKPFLKAGKRYYAMKARNKLYPITSGGAMNATDHPFGSGRGGPPYGGKASSIAPANAPPGRNVGMIRARRTGRKK